MVEIRQAQISDIDAICAVENCAFPTERQASRSALQQRLELFPSGVFVLICAGEIVAYSTAFPIGDRTTLEQLNLTDEELCDPNGAIYFLRNLAVKTEHQRKGFGKQLSQAQGKHALSIGKTFIRFTGTKNLEPLYQELGCKKLGNYNNYHGLPQVVWERALS
jgi:predicted N-acetyltransferase YhbS